MEIYDKVMVLLREVDKSEPFRLLGIRLDKLTSNKEAQSSFLSNEEEKDDNLQKVLDNINSKYDNFVIMPAIFYKDN